MQELKSFHEDGEGLVEDSKNNYPVPDGFDPVGVEVTADLKENCILLKVRGIASVRLSLRGARDLALILRQQSNRIERGKS